QTATFSVAASGTSPLSYQWQKNGTTISGATAASYTTPTETTADSGAQFTVVVSNAAGSATSAAATLTVNASTLSLSASPTSLSFGNVNVSSSASLSTTVSNNGNSNVTISGVSVTGTGYSASGLSSGQVLTPGQSATLSVTFTPAAAGSVPGSVSIASNASNSPANVILAGSGVTSSTGLPTCGISGDTSNHVPTDWTTFLPPAKGKSYVDPTFGCTVTRITDASSQDWSGSFFLPLNMGYATVSPFNANDTYLMLSDGWRRYFVTDLTGNIVVPIANMPAMNNTWVLWDATSPTAFYYTYQNYLMRGTISGATVAATIVHQFTEYAAIDFMDETDVSQDGAHLVIVGGDTSGASPENVFDYDFVSNVKGPVYTTSCTGSVDAPNNGCLHKLIQTPDNNVIIQFANDGSGLEQGNRLWLGTSPLPALQNATNHLDAGYDKNGNAVYVELGNSSVLPLLTNPCPSGWGLDVRMIYNLASSVCLLDHVPAWHVGYRGNAQQPWVGLSFFDSGRSPSPEWFDGSTNYAAPTSSNWSPYEDEIMVVRIDANNNSSLVYRLARAYSRSNQDFYAQPHAAISRDGKYIAFNSNMAYAHTGCPANFQSSTGCTDVYVIRIQ
ncbi:MAG TPA: choice-of-anchor D domain-containing protein, partial [Terriglobales bacterium]|nr:choice-of-anchor D domain-containing protein [Terriglobales bacterium]